MKLNELVLQPSTLQQLQSLLVDPPQGLLLTGPTGIGKLTVATAWASQLTTPGYVTVIEPDEKGTITIETVRTLYQQTRSKHDARQIIIIDNAQSMGVEAQNAFLKLLEEPNAKVSFVLTAPTAQTLLPTITSRVQQVILPRIAASQLQKLVPNSDPQTLAQQLFVADGRPGTLVALVRDPEVFEQHKKQMQRAKQLLTAGQYERLALVTELAKDRQGAIDILEAVNRMLYTQILRDPQPRWLHLAEHIETTLLRLNQNGNPRAQLTALFTSY